MQQLFFEFGPKLYFNLEGNVVLKTTQYTYHKYAEHHPLGPKFHHFNRFFRVFMFSVGFLFSFLFISIISKLYIVCICCIFVY